MMGWMVINKGEKEESKATSLSDRDDTNNVVMWAFKQPL